MSIFVLGAGFSKPAGLPLGVELFSEVIRLAKLRYMYDNILEPDITSYLDYLRDSKGIFIQQEQINLEEFVSYLDIEHYLRLKGSDTWSEEGNKSQIIVRNLIALALHLRQSKIREEAMFLYEDFIERLEPNDIIITFNYDTILETALYSKEIPFRLVPYRYDPTASDGRIILDTEELILIKMHGSIDWFDISEHDKRIEYLRNRSIDFVPPHLIFDGSNDFHPIKIIDGAYPSDSPLNNIYRISNLDTYFTKSNLILEVPLIISPSFNKLFYLNPLREFWNGFNRGGLLENRVVIIGFSLPEHDEYIRQPLYKLVTNFQRYDKKRSGIDKQNLKMVDFRQTQEGINKFKQTYRFVDWTKTDCYFDGFNAQAVEMIFE